MFGKTGIELLQEVAQCPADSLPAFNVSLKLAAARVPAARCWLRGRSRRPRHLPAGGGLPQRHR